MWEEEDILSTQQHGFRPGRGTESAILHVINLISAAHHNKESIFTTFWDITRAFDSVSKNVLKASWIRLGVPEDIAHWFVSMDMGGGVIPRSPEASEEIRQNIPRSLSIYRITRNGSPSSPHYGDAVKATPLARRIGLHSLIYY